MSNQYHILFVSRPKNPPFKDESATPCVLDFTTCHLTWMFICMFALDWLDRGVEEGVEGLTEDPGVIGAIPIEGTGCMSPITP